MLQSCNLPPLASRRHYLKLCLLYQIVNGQLNFPAPIVQRNLSISLRNTSTLALERPATHTNAHQLSFSLHIIVLRNSLPPSAQNCHSLHSFKQTAFVTHLTPHLTQLLSSIWVHYQVINCHLCTLADTVAWSRFVCTNCLMKSLQKRSNMIMYDHSK